MPETRHARSDSRPVAYQVVGDGPPVLVLVLGFVAHVETLHTVPGYTTFLDSLAEFARVVTLDLTGTGLSDRSRMPSFDGRMEDLLAVVDAVGAQKVVLFGASSGGALSVAFAADLPERTEGLVLFGAYPRFTATEELPFMVTPEHFELLREFVRRWGHGDGAFALAPSLAVTPEGRELWRSVELATASPSQATELLETEATIDVTDLLYLVQAPTLILHRVNEQFVPPQAARHMAKAIRGARLVLLDGLDHLPWLGNSSAVVDEIRAFLAGELASERSTKEMMAVLMTDIARSTELLIGLGDQRWNETLARHDEIAEAEVREARGRLIKSTGDGILAVFEHPADALPCAVRIREELARLGLDIRAGVTVGDVVFRQNDVTGVCVHIAERLARLAGPGQIYVSRGVMVLLTESKFEFVGPRVLKGVPGIRSVFELR